MTDEPPGERPVARGAEASVRAVDWWGFPALLKERDSKAYRPKALDERLRRERTRTEARLLVEARHLGVRTPVLYDIDLVHHRLIMEALPGPTLRQLLEEHPESPEALLPALRGFGLALGRLHAGGIAHGDLTSSNVLYPDGPSGAPAFIDLSMGSRSPDVEGYGIDLHLVEADVKAIHAQSDPLLAAFYEGYLEGNPARGREVRTRAREIRGRVRYA